jgi:hypothetical protein
MQNDPISSAFMMLSGSLTQKKRQIRQKMLTGSACAMYYVAFVAGLKIKAGHQRTLTFYPYLHFKVYI